MNKVKVTWKNGDTVSDWDEKCIRVVETFGLPGDKYTTELTADYMIFKFEDLEDAVIAKLMLGG